MKKLVMALSVVLACASSFAEQEEDYISTYDPYIAGVNGLINEKLDDLKIDDQPAKPLLTAIMVAIWNDLEDPEETIVKTAEFTCDKSVNQCKFAIDYKDGQKADLIFYVNAQSDIPVSIDNNLKLVPR